MLTARDLVRVLRRIGFIEIRTSVSHVFFKHQDGRATTVPFHSGKDIGRGLLIRILRDIELTVTDLLKLI
ncbi:MAG TPA: type II toxin-antitoxin system HicA family toxin [Candidatus Methylomirabilis sp.]|nr:type II toxin-antitoxin system HicA family toxin [Candidatus Methylomirabilis sp.]